MLTSLRYIAQSSDPRSMVADTPSSGGQATTSTERAAKLAAARAHRKAVNQQRFNPEYRPESLPNLRVADVFVEVSHHAPLAIASSAHTAHASMGLTIHDH